MVGEVAIALGVLDNLLEGCQVIDTDYRYAYVNEAAVAHGRATRDQLLGNKMTECYPGIETTEMFQTLQLCMEQRSSHTLENEFTFPDGSVGWFELRFQPVPAGVAILSVEITERKRTERALIAAQRLEAVGQLAGGIAHDFNNLLSVILLYSDFAANQLPKDHPVRADIEQVQKAGLSAGALTRQLLAFSRKQIMEPQITSVNDVVRGIETMVRRLLSESIDIVVDLADDLSNTLVDPGQLEQVLMNLVVNARDAMPDGGVLTIETAHAELDSQYVETHLFDVKPGRYVRLSVSDTGQGMPADTRNRIFEPFFSTKEAGKGTGLGLAMVYGIVKQSDGNIWVYSEPGRGTIFKIYFPCVDGAPAQKIVRNTEVPRGDELVLVVEDDAGVRAATRRILEAAGYRVITAPNGEEALRMSRDLRVDLLLSDVVLPVMSGRKLARRLRERFGSMKILFTSGYSEQTVVREELLDGGVRFLSKPFTSLELTTRVRATLDGTEG